MGKYDHILGKTADVQYKVLLADLAWANEASETNRLKRIELAMGLSMLDTTAKAKVETMIQEDVDLEDQTADD